MKATAPGLTATSALRTLLMFYCDVPSRGVQHSGFYSTANCLTKFRQRQGR